MTSLRQRLIDSWVVRSLGAGVVGSVLDHTVGTVCALTGLSTRWAAMAGKVTGAVFGFFALRYFAFVDHRTSLVGSAVRFVVVNAGIAVLHGQVTVWLRDGTGLPYLASALAADLLVVTPLSLIASRFAIFPRHRVDGAEPAR